MKLKGSRSEQARGRDNPLGALNLPVLPLLQRRPTLHTAGLVR